MKLVVFKGKSLTTEVYRGFATAQYLARISEADVFDQEKNPDGTQRDLSRQHAREANQYARGEGNGRTLRIWPEVILNVRDKKVVRIGRADAKGFLEIEIFDDKIKKTNGTDPQISRVDGNHRLFYADGIGEGRARTQVQAIKLPIPFSLTIGLDTQAESALFTDINATPKRMNTSHLAHLYYRLHTEAITQEKRKPLWIAEKLRERTTSPFYKRMYLGGKPPKGKKHMLSLTLLERCSKMTLDTSKYLQDSRVNDDNALKIVEMYWNAVSETWIDAWSNAKDYSLLKSVSMYAMALLGAEIIDRSFKQKSLNKDHMKKLLKHISAEMNWTNTAFEGFAGLAGAKAMFNSLRAHLPPEVSIEDVLSTI